jgi:hypothetical protein
MVTGNYRSLKSHSLPETQNSASAESDYPQHDEERLPLDPPTTPQVKVQTLALNTPTKRFNLIINNSASQRVQFSFYLQPTRSNSLSAPSRNPPPSHSNAPHWQTSRTRFSAHHTEGRITSRHLSHDCLYQAKHTPIRYYTSHNIRSGHPHPQIPYPSHSVC